MEAVAGNDFLDKLLRRLHVGGGRFYYVAGNEFLEKFLREASMHNTVWETGKQIFTSSNGYGR